MNRVESELLSGRKRPYIGQDHCVNGERGKQVVRGLTIRDVCDCMSIINENVYDKRASMLCNLEMMMGRFPNLPKYKFEKVVKKMYGTPFNVIDDDVYTTISGKKETKNIVFFKNMHPYVKEAVMDFYNVLDETVIDDNTFISLERYQEFIQYVESKVAV
jgi:hypothetical protein